MALPLPTRLCSTVAEGRRRCQDPVVFSASAAGGTRRRGSGSVVRKEGSSCPVCVGTAKVRYGESKVS